MARRPRVGQDMTMSTTPPIIDNATAQDYAPQLYQTRHVVEPIDGLDAITDAHLEQYRELGFLSIANALSAEQVDAARAALSDLIMGNNPQFKGVQFEASARERLDKLTLDQREAAVRKLMVFCDYDARLNALKTDAPLMKLVRRLMHDRTPTCFQEMALLKPPGGREKPWHQDQAYFKVKLGEPVVGIWLALDEAAVANGCMHVIPGSHRDGPVIHFQRRDWQICDTQVRTDQVVACPLSPGGVLLFDGLLHHGTPKNRTDQRRRALQFHYCPDDAEWADEQTRQANFGNKGKDVEC